MYGVQPTELTVLLRRRRERDEAKQQIAYAGYDIYWPDGRPVSVGLRRFCRQGTRLLVGRAGDPEQALIKLSLYPVAGPDAARTRPGPGVRCRRFSALRVEDAIQLYFLFGVPTEVVFDLRRDEAAVLHWLQAERIRPSEPFWFDLASQVLHQSYDPVAVGAKRASKEAAEPIVSRFQEAALSLHQPFSSTSMHANRSDCQSA